MAMLSVRINIFEKKAGRNMKFNNKDAARFDKKKELDKIAEPKALLSVDSTLNWSDHQGEDVENGAAQVYGMIAGAEVDATGGATGNATDDGSTAAAEFALMGISSQRLTPSLKDGAEKPPMTGFVKAVGMNVVPPPITGTFMPPSNNPDLDDTQFTYGSKSNNYSETNFVSNDFSILWITLTSLQLKTMTLHPCFKCQSSSSKTNDPLASAPSSVDYKPVSKTADQQSNSTNDDSSFSFKENVNFHLIKDCDDFYEKQLELHNKPMWTNVANIPSFVPKAASVPAGSRNRPTSVPAGSPNSQNLFLQLLE
ncbi:hypothetical protein Tco_0476204 [Tanacetum coccineum]